MILIVRRSVGRPPGHNNYISCDVVVRTWIIEMFGARFRNEKTKQYFTAVCIKHVKKGASGD